MAVSKRWLVLIHAIPPRPHYLRVKAGRRLRDIGAVAVKNSVYALPHSEAAREQLDWIAKEIGRSGGEASILDGAFLAGMTDVQLVAAFQAERQRDWHELAEELRRAKRKPGLTAAQLGRLRKQFEEISEIDFFDAPGRRPAELLLQGLARRDRPQEKKREPPRRVGRRRTWVTRAGIHIDRMASAWLIRRFIDPQARFRFVDAGSYQHRPGELRFDMFGGEYTHDGDLCTFEVLIRDFHLEQRGLGPLGEIVHDIDLKDGRYGHPETAGIQRVVNGIAAKHPADLERLRRAGELFDVLFASYRPSGASR
ncbi:MAG TPA: chromate resistance protein ChrB domain-containing protein [Myxococcaceae bacterium]|nr:chromate resistance protein ChrB domain-containing protein [Myxococcaceae bacterium]